MEQKLKFITNADVSQAELLVRQSTKKLTIGEPVVGDSGAARGYTVAGLKAAGLVGVYEKDVNDVFPSSN